MSKPTITTWTKLEPNPLGDDLQPTLQGRVYDPAWMLARQWQVGEFAGEDAGSPINVTVDVRGMSLSGFCAGGGAHVPIGGLPVSYLAGAEPRGERLMIEAAEAGAELVTLLREHGAGDDLIDELTLKFPLSAPFGQSADSGAPDFLAFLSPAPGAGLGLPNPFTACADGWTLEELLINTAKAGSPDPRLGLKVGQAGLFTAAAAEWAAWQDSLCPENASGYSWDDEYLEHNFTIDAMDTQGNAVSLAGANWNGAPLDWYSFDIAGTVPGTPSVMPVSARPLKNLSRGLTARQSGLPTPLAYAGMPSARWWEFEDSKINFMQISSAESDLARLLVVEFALANGNDWYLVPMELSAGALYNVTNFTVTNTFGETRQIAAVSDKKELDWSLFRQSYADDRGRLCDGLLLFPADYTQESAAIEQVRFFRDEAANVAWAMEALVEGPDGRPVDRQQQNARGKGGPPDPGAELRDSYEYELLSDIPANWFPLVPNLRHMYQMLLMDPDIKPLGRILRGQGSAAEGESRWLSFWQEEVPREGSEVSRRYILSRGAGGRVLLWRGRQKRAGRGEASSGLTYDSAK